MPTPMEVVAVLQVGSSSKSISYINLPDRWCSLMFHPLPHQTMVVFHQIWGDRQTFGLNISENPGLRIAGSDGGKYQLCLQTWQTQNLKISEVGESSYLIIAFMFCVLVHFVLGSFSHIPRFKKMGYNLDCSSPPRRITSNLTLSLVPLDVHQCYGNLTHN